MIRPINVATDGYISCKTKHVLIIAIAGWLSYCGPIPPSGGGHRHYPQEVNTGGRSYNIVQNELRNRLLQEDEEILIIIKAYMQCRK